MLAKAVVVVVLAVVLAPVLRMMWNMGYGLHFHKHQPGPCRVVKRPGTGSEDFQILTSGLAFITSGLTEPQLASDNLDQFVRSKGKGGIQLLDMNVPGSSAESLTIKHNEKFNPDIFRPHGISVLEDKVKGEHLVYVINHAEEEDDRVEKFRYNPKTKELHHMKSIFSDMFRLTNDLVVVSEDKFYITNWMYFNHRIFTIVEQIYRPPLGGVFFYNGTGVTKVLSQLFSPNSLMMDKSKQHVYLSLPSDTAVHVYKRNSDYDLQLVQNVNVHSGLDNFHLSENGNSLFGGCQPLVYKSLSYAMNPAERKAPSQVLRLPLRDDGLIDENEITEKFYDHGDLISASSIAGVYKNQLLIGSVVEKLVVCQMPPE